MENQSWLRYQVYEVSIVGSGVMEYAKRFVHLKKSGMSVNNLWREYSEKLN